MLKEDLSWGFVFHILCLLAYRRNLNLDLVLIIEELSLKADLCPRDGDADHFH